MDDEVPGLEYEEILTHYHQEHIRRVKKEIRSHYIRIRSILPEDIKSDYEHIITCIEYEAVAQLLMIELSIRGMSENETALILATFTHGVGGKDSIVKSSTVAEWTKILRAKPIHYPRIKRTEKKQNKKDRL